MRIRRLPVLAGGIAALLVIAVMAARNQAPSQGVALQGKKKMAGETAAREAIQQASRDFVTAFGRGDAKALARAWTTQGEYHDEASGTIRGHADLEKAFAAHFKEKPKATIEIHIQSLRFLSPDSAIEDGFLRQSNASRELPTTTRYTAVHVREAGQWKMAVVKEWGAGEDRLEDLDWLIGAWTASAKDREVRLTIARDKNKPFLVGEFTAKVNGKAASSGTMKIGFDAQRGQLRSWHFDDDGGHGQALWIRDGSRWVLDAIGVTGGGAETACVNILGRVNNDEITWRSIDRVIGDEKMPDTVPVKLRRAVASK